MAQGSLPGDPLYGIKRMEEQVWLALTLDPVERRLVEETLAARRWEEYRLLTQQRGIGTVTWEGRAKPSKGPPGVSEVCRWRSSLKQKCWGL